MTAGFGLEYLGVWSLRQPKLAAAVVIAVSAALIYGATHLDFESDIREIFRSDSSEYATLEEAARQYPASEQDVLIVLQADDLMRRDRLEAVRTLHLELMLVDGVTEALSIFSARAPPDGTGDPAPMIPAELSDDADLEALKKRLLGHALVSGKLLSGDGTLTMVVVSLDRDLDDLDRLSAVFSEMRSIGREVLEGSGVTMALTGMPMMRIEIIDSLRRDQLTFKVIGFSFGLFLTWLFFRRIRYALVAGTPVVIAVLWQLGAMWLFGQTLNVLTAVVPTLVMVVAFSDSLHLLFAVRHNLGDGDDVEAAIEKAVLDVGPACVLTSLTTTLALLSLTLVPHPFISGFGFSGAMGTVIAFLATIVVFPVVALVVMKSEKGDKRPPVADGRVGAAFISSSRWVAGYVARRSRIIVGVSIATAIVASLAYGQNRPHHVYKENLPARNEAFRAISAVDGKLAGTGTIYAFLKWKDGADMFTPERISAISEAHDALGAAPQIGSVWSLKSIADWFESGAAGEKTLAMFLREHADLFANRVISEKDQTALITGYFANVDASKLVPVLDDIERRLQPLRDKYPDMTVSVTGIDAVSARASTAMIHQLNRSLILAIVVIIIAVGFALRSARASLVSILPNILPIAIGGSYLYLTDAGLQFTSVVAFTISFGIAVDSTIHMLNRYRLETAVEGKTDRALYRTITTIGPVLLVSTVVLVFGLGVTMTSVMPTVQLYGRVSVIVLVAALAANMVFLPAVLKLLADTRRK